MLRIENQTQFSRLLLPPSLASVGKNSFLKKRTIIFHFKCLIDQATPGFELGKKDLQSPALPLGHAANKNRDMKSMRILPLFLLKNGKTILRQITTVNYEFMNYS